jgi:hypothetical protein
MGMFDNIKIKAPLPLTEELKKLNIDWANATFQTKDLDNCLSDYFITESGELKEEVTAYEYTYYTEEEIKSKSFRPWNFIKESKIKNQYQKQVDFHGKITFYELFEVSEEEDIWVDFEAFFIYGKLDKINLIKTEKQKSGKVKLKEWVEEDKKKTNSLAFKLKKYSGYFLCLSELARFASAASNFFAKLQSFSIRRMN